MKSLAIVITAFDRPDSLRRLLRSVEAAKPPRCPHHFVVSIDGGGSDKVVEIANEFASKKENREVLVQSQNLGLKQHIYKCGDLSTEHEGIVLLEDDLLISPNALQFAEEALRFSSNEDSIAGISLYSTLYNETAHRPFLAKDDGADSFYLAIPSSWGQGFTKKQWSRFKEWLEEDQDYSNLDLPANVREWPATSWKRDFQAFMIDTDKTFLYPRVSYSTNFGEPGAHFKRHLSRFQVPLEQGRLGIDFSTPGESQSKYDAYCETTPDSSGLNSDAIIDLYGTKNLDRYPDGTQVITVQETPGKVLKTFGRRLKPIELNVIYETSGSQIKHIEISGGENNGSKPVSFRVKNNSELDYWYGLSTNVIWPIIEQNTDEVRSSSTFRVGKFILAPFRFIFGKR